MTAADAMNYKTSCSSKAEEEQVADEIDTVRRGIQRIKSQREDQMRSIALSASILFGDRGTRVFAF